MNSGAASHPSPSDEGPTPPQTAGPHPFDPQTTHLMRRPFGDPRSVEAFTASLLGSAGWE